MYSNKNNKKSKKKSKKISREQEKISLSNLYNDEESHIIRDETNLNPIIKNSLEYYDLNMIAIKEFNEKIEYFNFKKNTGNISDKIIFYNKDKIKILESKYEILSVFNSKFSSWKWSWAVPTFRNKSTFMVRKILEYAFTLNYDDDFILKSLLINSKINIQNDLQHDIILALSSYITKIPFIFKFYIAGIDLTEKIVGININDKFYKSNELPDNEEQKITDLIPIKMIENSEYVSDLIAIYVFIPDFTLD